MAMHLAHSSREDKQQATLWILEWWILRNFAFYPTLFSQVRSHSLIRFLHLIHIHTDVRSVCPLWHCRWSRPFTHALPLTRCLRLQCNDPVSWYVIRRSTPYLPTLSYMQPRAAMSFLYTSCQVRCYMPPATSIFPHISLTRYRFRASQFP